MFLIYWNKSVYFSGMIEIPEHRIEKNNRLEINKLVVELYKHDTIPIPHFQSII